MNEHIQKFNERLIGHFQTKAAEFDKRSEENPQIAKVTTELSGLYQDLARLMQS